MTNLFSWMNEQLLRMQWLHDLVRLLPGPHRQPLHPLGRSFRNPTIQSALLNG